MTETMEAKKFTSNEEIGKHIQGMIANQTESVTFVSGKRTKIAIVLKNSEIYQQYKNHLLQYDVTANGQVYTVIIGVK